MHDGTTDPLQDGGVTTAGEPGSEIQQVTTSGEDHTVNNGDAVDQTSSKLSLKSLEIGACGMTSASASAVAALITANVGLTSLR